MIFNWTGNPWVDAGIVAILEWCKKDKPEDITIDDIKKLSVILPDIYLSEAWNKNMHSIFPNSLVINPSVRDKKNRLQIYYGSLIDGVVTLGITGDCIACGRRNSISGKNRTHIPLSGYEGSHFFSFKTEGVDYCDVCTFAVQCSPLIYYACGKLILLHTNSPKVMRYWARRCIAEIHKQIASRNFTGCFNERYTNPTNALFHITQDLILSYDEQWLEENVSIRMYHFTNYNQGADLEIYDLPSPVFRFLAYVRTHQRYSDWRTIIRKGYRNIEKKEEEEYRNYKNSVYQSLLQGRSILRCFFDNRKRKVIGDWSLIKYYLKEVLRMDDSRINTIRKLGDDISGLIKTESNGKKRLAQLEMASNYASFRNILFRLMKDGVVLKAEQPLFTFDDYVNNIFPDGAMGWKETQDLLLFRLYENLHQWLIKEGVVIEETEESEEVVND